MASADVSPVVNEWVDVSITPNTLLAAGTEYTISHRASGATRNLYRDPTGVEFNSAITKTANVFGSSDAIPTLTTSDEHLAARFKFK